MNVGYIYVIEFDGGTVKVGQSKTFAHRLRMHKQNARSFGLEITRHWVSPRHCGWLENEEALKRAALGLGGTARTAEYFTGVDFDALVKKARKMPFKAPEVAAADEPQQTRAPKPASTAAPTIRLRTEQFTRYAETQGLKGCGEIADRTGLDRVTVFRLLKGESAPSGRFIATVLAAFPDRRFEEFFEVTAPEPVTRKRAA